MVKVFYDGKCGLCNREIDYYRRVAPPNAFSWQDIANDPTCLNELGITQSDALRRLHVLDTSGGLHVGVLAFIAIWQRLRYWRFLAMAIKLPVILPLATLLYNRFADYRFDRLSHCQLALKDVE